MDRSNTRPQGVELFAIACQRHGLSLTNPDRIRGYNEIRYIAAPNFPTSKLPLRIPLRIVTGSEAPLTVYARDEFTKALAIAYVWHVHQRPRFFLLSYSEALGVLGEQRVCMPAWESYGYWHITNLDPERQRQMAPFEDRWEWLRNRLDEYGGRVSY